MIVNFFRGREIEVIRRLFPGIEDADYSVASEIDPKYNCVAWVLGQNDRFPPTSDIESSGPMIDEIVEFFTTEHGFSKCDQPNLDDAHDSIALYATRDRKFKHVAVWSAEAARWTSKLGSFCDITHSLEALEGEHGTRAGAAERAVNLLELFGPVNYGSVVCYMTRATDAAECKDS